MKNRPTALNVAPRLGWLGSLLLHAGIIAATLFTWSHTLELPDESTPVVPVDLVTLADKTNIAPMITEAPKPPEEQPQPQEQPQPIPQPQPQPKAAPQPVEAAPTLDRVPSPKPAPPKPKDKFDINNIMALLDKKKSAAPTQKNARLGTQNIKGVGAMDAMTADLRSLLQSEVYKCWSPPVGSPHPEKLIVSYELFLRRDGTIAQAPQLLGTGGSANDPYMRAAVEAARRAIYTCAPYKLPADRYNQWRDVNFVFDPREMIGQ
jgi:hypothetical protein